MAPTGNILLSGVRGISHSLSEEKKMLCFRHLNTKVKYVGAVSVHRNNINYPWIYSVSLYCFSFYFTTTRFISGVYNKFFHPHKKQPKNTLRFVSKVLPASTCIFFFLCCRYNPLWVLAFSAIFFNSVLSLLSFLHPLLPIVWISSSTSSIHLFLGRPLILLPIGFHSNIRLDIFPPSNCITCPSKAILLLSINLTVSAFPISSFSSWFFLILQISIFILYRAKNFP